jgi:adenylosuccinate lyase
VHSLAAAARLKAEGGANDLAGRLQADPAFAGIDVASCLDPKRAYGRCPEQVDAFIAEQVEPIRAGLRRSHDDRSGDRPVKNEGPRG